MSLPMSVRRKLTDYLPTVVPLSFLGAFVIYPVAAVILDGLVNGPGQTLPEVLSSSITLRTVSFTLLQSALSVALSLLLGVPGAFLISRLRFRGKALVRAAIVIPFVLPPIAVVVGFLRMLGSNGILDQLAMLLIGSPTSVLNLATGLPGIVLAHAFYNTPLVILMISASLEKLSPEVEESADILGASTIQKLRHIVLPHIAAALLSAAMLVFLFCFMSFPIILALGQEDYVTIEVEIWYAFRYFDYGKASSLALIQVCVTLSLASVYALSARKPAAQATHTLSIKTRGISELGLAEKVAVITYMAILTILVAGPIASIAYAAVYDPVSNQYTLRGLQNLLDPAPGGGLVALANSIFYSTMATVLSLALALPLAYARRSSKRRMSTLTSGMVLLPLGVSSITTAYGLLRMVAVPLGWNRNPWPIIVMAQTIIGLPFTTRSIENSLSAVSPDYLEQAESLGADRMQRLFFVEIPLLAPGIVVGGVFAFAMAIGEMSATLFIALPQNVTLAVATYGYLGVRKFVEAGAAALVIVIACIAAFITIERLSHGGSGGALSWSE